MNREEWVNKGFVDESVDKSIDLKAAINELKRKECGNPGTLLPERRNTGYCRLHWGQSGFGLKLQPKPMRIFL